MSELKRHADGVYIDLSFEDYLADDAIGGHGALALSYKPGDWRWERDDNPMWDRAASSSPAKQLGTLLHCRLLEGEEMFATRYGAPPARDAYPDAVDTATQIKAKLKTLEADYCRAMGVDKLSREERQPFLQSGALDELETRLRTLVKNSTAADVQFWKDIVAEVLGQRQPIERAHADFTALATRMAATKYGGLLELGNPYALSEVSIFWTSARFARPVRFKARWDRIAPARIVDVKKYGLPPKPQHCLRQHCVEQAARYGYPVQAVMHAQGAKILAANPALPVFGADAAQTKALACIREAWAEKAPVFWWLFLRCPGPPGGKPIPFRESDAMWQRASQTIDEGVANWLRFTEAFGDEIWFEAEDAEEISSEIGALSDWPAWAFDTPGGFE